MSSNRQGGDVSIHSKTPTSTKPAGIVFRKPGAGVTTTTTPGSPAAAPNTRFTIGPPLSTSTPVKSVDRKGKGISSKKFQDFSLSPEPRAIRRHGDIQIQQAILESNAIPALSPTKDSGKNAELGKRLRSRNALTDVSNSPARKKRAVDSNDDSFAPPISSSTPVKQVTVFRDAMENDIAEISEEKEESESAAIGDPFSLDTLTANLFITEVVEVDAKEAGFRVLGTGRPPARPRSRGIARTRGRKRSKEQGEEPYEEESATPGPIPDKATSRRLRRQRELEVYEVLSPPRASASDEEAKNKAVVEIDAAADSDNDDDDICTKPVENQAPATAEQANESGDEEQEHIGRRLRARKPPAKALQKKKSSKPEAEPVSLLPSRHFVNPSVSEMIKRKRYRETKQNAEDSFTQQMRNANEYLEEVTESEEEEAEPRTRPRGAAAVPAVEKQQPEKFKPAAATRRQSYARRRSRGSTITTEPQEAEKSKRKSSSSSSLSGADVDTESASDDDLYKQPESREDEDAGSLVSAADEEAAKKRAETFAALRAKFAAIDQWKLRVDSVDVSPDDSAFEQYATVAESSSAAASLESSQASADQQSSQDEEDADKVGPSRPAAPAARPKRQSIRQRRVVAAKKQEESEVTPPDISSISLDPVAKSTPRPRKTQAKPQAAKATAAPTGRFRRTRSSTAQTTSSRTSDENDGA